MGFVMLSHLDSSHNFEYPHRETPSPLINLSESYEHTKGEGNIQHVLLVTRIAIVIFKEKFIAHYS
jgi:hypothetical protein